ncbi:hypothetical protein F5Y09DRAFT_135506 [Xylaria sp. FL1042]|nr:hypothetical protein F5Y09DRAFT_135506 [Xylaria sp. FL1042]
MHTNGCDGVIDLGSAAGSLYRHRYPALYLIDVDNSLNIDSHGSFTLGPQWQVPRSSTARSNAGPKFGPTSIWVERGRGNSSNDFDREGRQSGWNHASDNDETQKGVSSDRTTGTSPQGFLATCLRAINLKAPSYQGHQEHQARASSWAQTYNHYDNGCNGRVICRDPAPADLTMSGARGPGPSHKRASSRSEEEPGHHVL